jgi:DNA-binding transcriptional MerR regulator
MRIGELARCTGVSVRSLRYYEEEGLLAPARATNGYRDYAESTIGRVRNIQLLYAAGLTSKLVTRVLPAPGRMTTTVVMPAGISDELQKVRARLAQEIEERKASLHLLEEVIAASPERVIAAVCQISAAKATG